MSVQSILRLCDHSHGLTQRERVRGKIAQIGHNRAEFGHVFGRANIFVYSGFFRWSPRFCGQYARVHTRSILEGFGGYVKVKGKPDPDPAGSRSKQAWE